jgi:hypothetical protein
MSPGKVVLGLLLIASIQFLVAADETVIGAEVSKPKAVPKPKPKPLKKPTPKKGKARKPRRPRYVGGDIMFNRFMNVRGVMAAGSIIANNATVKGTLIARQLKTKRLKAHTMSVGELKTTRLSSPTGTIVIEGDLLITHSRALEFGTAGTARNGTKTLKAKKGGKKGSKAPHKSAKGMSFLAEEVIVGGVKQWALVRQEHFQNTDEQDNGWRLVGSPNSDEAIATSVCERMSPNDRFLGGHCQLSNGPVRKMFAHLPPHSQIRLTARYHFIDHWTGETAFASIDNHYMWTQSHRVPPQTAGITVGMQLCGSDQYPETRMSSPIDVTAQHTADHVWISFGSHSASSGKARSLKEEQQSACDRSFGIDDVEIYVR